MFMLYHFCFTLKRISAPLKGQKSILASFAGAEWTRWCPWWDVHCSPCREWSFHHNMFRTIRIILSYFIIINFTQPLVLCHVTYIRRLHEHLYYPVFNQDLIWKISRLLIITDYNLDIIQVTAHVSPHPRRSLSFSGELQVLTSFIIQYLFQFYFWLTFFFFMLQGTV